MAQEKVCCSYDDLYAARAHLAASEGALAMAEAHTPPPLYVMPPSMQPALFERPRLMEMDHGIDQDDDPGMFRFTVTFAEQANGKTVLMMRQLAASPEQRDGMIGFGAVEYGYQTLDKLAAYVGALRN